MQIDNIDNILTITGSEKELEKKLTRIVNDIENGTVKSKKIKKSKNICRYLYTEKIDYKKEI